MKLIARPPPDSLSNDYQNECEKHSWVCNTCWQSVTQEYILGIWKHDDPRRISCTNLVPVRRSDIDMDKQWHCIHDFERVDGLDGIKCTKCGMPKLGYNFTGYDARTRKNYYCKECGKEFKLLEQHYEGKHKRKIFVYREIKN